MDLYKMKFKAAFRWRKVKSFFKLCEYNFRKKFNLEGDDQFYYHLQRQLLRDILHTSAEQEYLEEHGLLPEEPEVEPEPEPESEPEPGLVRELGFASLMFSAIGCQGITYMVAELKEYEDRMYLKISRVEDYEVTEHDITVSHQTGERYTDFTVTGQALRFDGEELKLLNPNETE